MTTETVDPASPPATPPASPPSTPPVTPPAADPPDWRAALPEDIRNDTALKDIKDVPSLAKSMIHAQKLVGMDRNKLAAVPSEDADEATWNDFYEKLGRPKTADDYALPVDEKMFNESFQRSEDMEKWYKSTAHKYGLTAKQAAGLYQEYVQWGKGMVDGNGQRLAQMRDQATAELKKEWGAAYDSKFKNAINVIRKFADQDFVDMLDNTGLGSHPTMLRIFDKIATTYGEDTLSDPSRSTVAMTPTEAAAAIAQKYNDKSFMEAYHKGDHPSHKWAVEEMSKLYRFQIAGNQ